MSKRNIDITEKKQNKHHFHPNLTNKTCPTPYI